MSLTESSNIEKQIENLLHDSLQSGIDTHNNLLKQSDQLNRNNSVMNNMENQISVSENILDGLECVWYKFVNLFRETNYVPEEIKKNTSKEKDVKSTDDTDLLVSDLKELSLDIGNEIDKSIDLIKALSDKSEKLDQREKNLMHRQKKIVNS